MKKVTKAVIPAAGLGTRVLPATKAMPKGMLPLVDKPAIQYLVEEAVRSGITDILIIVSRNQDIIQDHFDRSPELEAKLAAPGKEKMLEECLGISNLANIFFVRQQQTLGLGHAVSMAKPFTGDDPFVVIYGDDVIWGEDPVCAQLIRSYEEFGRPAAGVSAVPWADVSRYCSLKTTPIHDNYFFVDDMIEKNKEKAQKKKEKRGEKAEKINAMAQTNTKSIKSSATKSSSMSDIEREEKLEKARANAKPGSLASKANMVKNFNENK